MDNLKEFWQELKERISNPLFASFTISWLIYNYKIPILFIFYHKHDLPKAYSTYIDVIEKNTSWLYSFILPLLTGLFYTFIYPYFKSYIKIYLAKIDFTEEARINNLGHIATVPLAKFLETRSKLRQQEGTLVTLISEEEIISNQNKNLSDRIIVLANEHEKNIQELNARNDERVRAINSSSEEMLAEVQQNSLVELTRVQKTYNDLLLECNEYKLRISEINAEKTSLNNELNVKAGQLLLSTEQNKKLLAELHDIQMNLSSNQNDQFKLSEELSKSNGKIRVLINEQKDQAATLTSLQGQRDALKENEDKLRNEIYKLESKVSNLENQNAERIIDAEEHDILLQRQLIFERIANTYQSGIKLLIETLDDRINDTYGMINSKPKTNYLSILEDVLDFNTGLSKDLKSRTEDFSKRPFFTSI
jgi:chromosome segregation ATPase